VANAVEKLPDIEDLLGDTELAAQFATELRNMSFNLRRFKEMQVDETLKETDPIPGALTSNGSKRTFKQQYDQIKRAYDEKWKRIDEKNLRDLVTRQLAEQKDQ
jgi:hypothetical protein